MSDNIQIIKKSWNGINIEIHYAPIYFKLGNDYTLSHIDVYSENKRPLPITETGYRSHFFEARELDGYADIWAYVLAWIEHEAKTNSAWKAIEQNSKQLTLFYSFPSGYNCPYRAPKAEIIGQSIACF